MSKRVGRALNGALLLVVAVALAMGGLALAETGDADPSAPDVPRGAYEHILDLLAPLVEEGTITAAQAAAVADRLADSLPAQDVRPPSADLLGALAELIGLPPGEIVEELAAGTSVAALAEQGGIAIDRVVDLLLAPLRRRLAHAVAAGELSEEEAAERLEHATVRVLDRVASDTPILDQRIERLERHRQQLRRRAAQKDAVLETLDVSEQELWEAAATGQSLADVAAARGVAAEDVVDALVEPLAERLEDAVAGGNLTEEEAAARLAAAEERATDHVTRPLRDRVTDRRHRGDRPRRPHPSLHRERAGG